MKEKMLILFFLILAFGMCGNGSSIEVNEPVEEDIETDVKNLEATEKLEETAQTCLLYTSPSPRDRSISRMPSSA